jgi:hypothetical protein
MRFFKYACFVAVIPVCAIAAFGSAAKLRFWNLTATTITELYLAPAGSEQYGPNQCLNDPDKAVDGDERLALTGVEPGHYDVKLTDKNKRHCVLHNVELKADGPYAFAIGEDDLKACKK